VLANTLGEGFSDFVSIREYVKFDVWHAIRCNAWEVGSLVVWLVYSKAGGVLSLGRGGSAG